jgi:hypothetical protein
LLPDAKCLFNHTFQIANGTFKHLHSSFEMECPVTHHFDRGKSSEKNIKKNIFKY